YALGFTEFWSVIGISAGIFASWTLIAMPLRRESAKLGAITLPDYLEARFQDKSHMLRWLSLIVILVFYTTYVGAQFVGAGKILHATFGIDPLWGIFIGALVVAFYTFMGGFLAVAYTDLIQGLLMVAVAVILPIIGLIHIGGPEALWEATAVRGTNFMEISGGKTGSAFFLGVMVGNLAWGFGYLGQPHLLTRYMAIKKTSDLRYGSLIAMGWVLLAYWGIVFIGIEGIAILGPDLADPEQVMPLVAKALLPGPIAGIMIAGAVAAMMSTADSQLLVATSALVEDIYARLINPEASGKKLVWLSRMATLLLTSIGLGLALSAYLSQNSGHLIHSVVSYAWAGLGSAFGPPLVLALWWKKTTRNGALGGMMAGLLGTLLWRNVDALQAIIDIKVAAPLLSLIMVVLISLISPDNTVTNQAQSEKSSAA
ncbi:sodium/proline symporter, partial [Myxococcota bacterium]|nr:sodium/proline symporter [Myxococcota bacterium]